MTNKNPGENSIEVATKLRANQAISEHLQHFLYQNIYDDEFGRTFFLKDGMNKMKNLKEFKLFLSHKDDFDSFFNTFTAGSINAINWQFGKLEAIYAFFIPIRNIYDPFNQYIREHIYLKVSKSFNITKRDSESPRTFSVVLKGQLELVCTHLRSESNHLV